MVKFYDLVSKAIFDIKDKFRFGIIDNSPSSVVLEYIASNVGNDVRTLEGSITRLLAYSTFMGGAEITLEPSQNIYLGKSRCYDLCLKCYDSISEKLTDVENEIFKEDRQ